MSADNNKKKILILGVSSWLGYLLANKAVEEGYNVFGSVFKSSYRFSSKITIKRINHSCLSYEKLINSITPDIIINFLRGEDAIGFSIHRYVIDYAKKTNTHYIYASSALALDGYIETELTEDLLANSVSHYGMFKAKCELDLYDVDIKWTILRFSSVQGWVPHKKTRNQSFLEKIREGVEVIVDRGILQNRILASLLIEGIIDLIKDCVVGIIHFGAENSSEEYTYLQKQAIAFGYGTKFISSGIKKNVNLVTVPQKVYELYGSKYRTYEEDTIQGLLNIEELKEFKNGSKN